MARGEDVEEQLAAGAVQGHEADRVEDDDVDALEAPHQAADGALVAGLEQGANEVGGAPESDTMALAGGLDAEGDSEVGLAGPDRPGEKDRCRG